MAALAHDVRGLARGAVVCHVVDVKVQSHNRSGVQLMIDHGGATEVRGSGTHIVLDPGGRLRMDPMGRSLRGYALDEGGQLVEERVNCFVEHRAEGMSSGRGTPSVQVTLPGGVTVAYAYDMAGRMLRRTHSVAGTTTFEWDGWDCVREVSPDQVVTRWGTPQGILDQYKPAASCQDEAATGGGSSEFPQQRGHHATACRPRVGTPGALAQIWVRKDLRKLYYYRGEVMHVGDTVKTGFGVTAQVVELTPPGQVSLMTGKICPNGGILVEEKMSGKPSSTCRFGTMLFEPYGAEWEDTDLVRPALRL